MRVVQHGLNKFERLFERFLRSCEFNLLLFKRPRSIVMKVLVTGGSGYLGQFVLQQLAADHAVCPFGRLKHESTCMHQLS